MTFCTLFLADVHLCIFRTSCTLFLVLEKILKSATFVLLFAVVTGSPMLDYDYSEDDLLEIGPTFASLALRQRDVDRTSPEFVPLLTSNYEDFVLDDEDVRLHLGELIATTKYATVFGLDSRADLAIKYAADCDVEDILHPLLRDGWCLNRLKDTGIVPTVHFVSPPAPMISEITSKTQFELSDNERIICVSENRGVRFMVMERIKMNLHTFVKSYGSSLKLAVRVMRWLVSALEIIHGKDIIHGDIHSGNVVIRNDNDHLALIDFGFAAHREEIELNDPQPYSPVPHDQYSCLHTHWELEGYRRSYRDDMFKVLLLGSLLIHGKRFQTYCDSLERKPERMRRFKSEKSLFDIPGGKSLGPTVKGKLDQMVANVRAMESVFVKPDYAYLQAQLDEIIV